MERPVGQTWQLAISKVRYLIRRPEVSDNESTFSNLLK